MATYYFGGDSCQVSYDAANADEAAKMYAAGEQMAGVETLDDLTDRIEERGGYLTVQEDGVVIARAK